MNEKISTKNKILLIWPFGAYDGATLPLCYIYMLPILRKSYQVRFLDCALHEIQPDSEKFTEIINDFKPDVVGISAWTIHKKNATTTLKKVKEIDKNIVTIAGGPHFTGSADYSLKSDQGIIDYVLKGEAEFTLKQFLDTIFKTNFSEDDLKKIDGLCFIKSDGSIHETPMTFPPTLDDFGQPDYSAIDIHAYLKKGYFWRTHQKMHAPILTTRGCPYTCDYCAAPYLNGRGVRKHSLEYLKKLIKNLYDNYGIRHFNIIDDNFTFDVFYAKAFCKMIIDNKHYFKGISIATPNGIRIERTDQQLFYLMKAAGWGRLVVAPESGSPKMLELMSKHLDLSVVPEKVRQIQKAGIEVEAFFLIGHPGEDKNTVEETRQFLKDVRFDFASFYAFQPLPGTPIYHELLGMGSISKADEMTSFSEVNWVPENWTKEELHDLIYDFKRLMVNMYPWRFECIFAKHTLMGKFIEKISDQHRRHKILMRVYIIRKKITDWIFILKHGTEIKKQINSVILDEGNIEAKRRRENKLKEYELSIMQKSDKLKEKARVVEVITKIPHLGSRSDMDMLLNNCDKIRTHKNMFED